MKKQWYQLMGVAVILVTVFGYLGSEAFAQDRNGWDLAYPSPTAGWINTWGSTANSDQPRDMVIDGSGNAYVTGQGGYGSGANYATIKINSAGVLQWVNIYDGAEHGQDVAEAIARDEEGYIYVTGWSQHAVQGDPYNWVTLKIDPDDGATIAIAEYDGPWDLPPTDYAHDLVAKGGYVYVTGCAKVAGGSTNYCTIKYYDDLSDSAWVRFYSGGYGDVAQALTVDNSGNVYVTGLSAGYYDHDYATIKYNANGVQQWAARYNGTGNGTDRATEIGVTANGSAVWVTGYSDSDPAYGGYNYDWVTIKYNSAGTELWVDRLNGPANGDDRPSALKVDSYGNAFVTGYNSILHGTVINPDYTTVKYKYDFNSRGWVSRYNGPGNGEDKALDLALDLSGVVYVTGSSVGTGTSKDYATLRYNPMNGAMNWVVRYNGAGNGDDVATAIAVDWAYKVYVTGYSDVTAGSVTNDDYVTIKYNQSGVIPFVNTDGEEDLSRTYCHDQTLIPATILLEQNCPNPFNPTTTISYALPQASWVNLAVYDVSGRQVAELVNDWREVGNHEAIFNGSKLTSGLYLYTLKAGTYSASGKMVLLK